VMMLLAPLIALSTPKDYHDNGPACQVRNGHGVGDGGGAGGGGQTAGLCFYRTAHAFPPGGRNTSPAVAAGVRQHAFHGLGCVPGCRSS